MGWRGEKREARGVERGGGRERMGRGGLCDPKSVLSPS